MLFLITKVFVILLITPFTYAVIHGTIYINLNLLNISILFRQKRAYYQLLADQTTPIIISILNDRKLTTKLNQLIATTYWDNQCLYFFWLIKPNGLLVENHSIKGRLVCTTNSIIFHSVCRTFSTTTKKMFDQYGWP